MTIKPLRILPIILCLGLLLSLPAAAAAATRLVKAMPDGGEAILTLAAAPLLTMTETPFSVELIGGTGTIIRDAAVSLQLTMPAMPMPPNNPKAPWKEGAYRGTAVFTMAGEWVATLLVQRPGHDMITLDFTLGQVLMK